MNDLSRDEPMTSPAERAVDLFLHQPCNCSQAVLIIFAEQFGLDRATALALAAPLGAGMGRSGSGPCGAVSGALLALGLAVGRLGRPPAEAKEIAYRTARDLLDQFRSRYGDTECRRLLGVDIGTPEGWQAAVERDLYKTVCPEFVRTSVQLVEALLADPSLRPPADTPSSSSREMTS